MITFNDLLESAILNSIYKIGDQKKSYYSLCNELKELSPMTSKVIDTVLNLKTSGYIRENINGDFKSLSLTENGEAYAKRIFKKISDEQERIKNYYSEVKDDTSENKVILTENKPTEYATFGENIQDVGEEHGK